MSIHILDNETINQIAAGEVIERPSSIVKELTENAIDAGSSSVTIEIKDGGTSLIRVTDNGSGIPADEVKTAFLRHATSKIERAGDLNSIMTLGFRGEALSSIAAVCRTEIITKVRDSVTGTRYVLENGNETGPEEAGAPDGTTVIARDVFFNTPARRKFLKSPSTEAAHITELAEQIAFSHPDVSILMIVNGQTRFHTSGNGKKKDIIYQIYGREIAGALIPVSTEKNGLRIDGYIGKPEIARGNRNLENFSINGRNIRSSILSRAVEDGYGRKMMQHQYPFAMLCLYSDPAGTDVNVHPSKMEVRFSNPQQIYADVSESVREAIAGEELIRDPFVPEPDRKPEQPAEPAKRRERPAEPFEINRIRKESAEHQYSVSDFPAGKPVRENKPDFLREEEEAVKTPAPAEERLLSETGKKRHRLIGDVFDTYWIVEYDGALYIIDQHAAHEKVLYEKLLKQYRNQTVTSQMLMPPAVLTVTDREGILLKDHMEEFEKAGYEIEEFGGNEISVHAVPDILPSVLKGDLLKEMIGSLSEETGSRVPEMILERTATMACKAAVKGGIAISREEADILIDELLHLDDPYNCPHGRPTIIRITKSDMEKKFKRVL